MTGQPKRSAKPIPDGYHAVTPYLTVPGLGKVIDFLKKTFDAEVRVKMEGPGGTIGHAEVQIGDSVVMMGEPNPNRPFSSAKPCNLYVYVKDVDATYRRAIEAGGKSQSEPKDQFYGDRSCGVEDSSGNSWWIATHIEDVTREEMQRRMAQMPKQG